MDDIDKKLIQALTDNARAPRRIWHANLESRAPPFKAALTVWKRGTIRGYTLRMGYANRQMIRASVLLAFDPMSGAEVLSKLRSLPEVRRAHTTSGRFDMLVEIAAQTTADLDRILDQIGSAKGVKSSESLIYLTIKLDRGASL